MDRREFLKKAGIAAAVMSQTSALTSCISGRTTDEGNKSAGPEAMTYRINPGNSTVTEILYGIGHRAFIGEE